MASISRYRSSHEEQREFQPGSGRRVLRNLVGVTNKRRMDRLEFDALVASQARYLATVSDKTRFTAALLRRMHRDWLGAIYPWAGIYREVELSKGGFRWPPARLVRSNMEAFESDTLIRCTPCRPAAVGVVASRIAEVHAELLLIHPFRDGNGRLARWLADLMALQAGLPAPEYGFSGRGAVARKARYLRGVQRGYVKDYQLLAGWFADALGRALDRRG